MINTLLDKTKLFIIWFKLSELVKLKIVIGLCTLNLHFYRISKSSTNMRCLHVSVKTGFMQMILLFKIRFSFTATEETYNRRIKISYILWETLIISYWKAVEL